jgi:hypothetical protein
VEQGKKRTVKSVEYGFYPLPEPPRGLGGLAVSSCFAKGTKVWTLTGQIPIERVKPGDRVLSQDVDSGELQYKPVLATTVNPKGRIMRIRLGGESIACTPAHPMWVVGGGWRMARQLAAGEQVHTLSGGATIASVETVKPNDPATEPAFNLIVADSSTYFVGQRGLLVHDNSPRKPTAALLPGFVDHSRSVASYEREKEASDLTE